MLLKNGYVVPVVGEPFVGDVSVVGGKIAALGAGLPDEAEVIDVSGLTVVPGMVDAHCHIGMWEDAMGNEGADGNECTNPITPELRAIDAVNPFDRCFEEAAAAGVTCAVTGPGSANVIGGQFVALKTHGDCVDKMIVKAPQAMKAAFGENPKGVYGSQKTAPSTRMAVAALLRKALSDALEYGKKLEAGEKDAEKLPERDIGKEMLLEVAKGRLPMKFHAHRADDIQTAIRIAREFGISYSLDHCTEGYLIPEQLKSAMNDGCLGIIVGPLLTDRSKIELKNLSMKAPAALHEAGIEFAMMTDHPVTPLMYLPVCAALAVRDGLPEDAALRSVTINAARVAGIADRVGSLEVGKDADIGVFSGSPIDVRSRCLLTLIDGEIVHNELK